MKGRLRTFVVLLVSVLLVVRFVTMNWNLNMQQHDHLVDQAAPNTLPFTEKQNTVIATMFLPIIVDKNQSIHPKQRHLEFIHIPSSPQISVAIEAAANKMGVQWGICHFVDTVSSRTHTDGTIACRKGNKHAGKYGKWRKGVPHWHLPHTYFRNHKLHNPYKNSDTFVIVSNPYKRMILLYTLAARHSKGRIRSETLTKEHLNHWIQVKLRGRGSQTHHFSKSSNYWTSGAVFVPQYDYIFDNKTQVVNHVLKAETIKVDFPKLMKQYQLEMIQLPTKKFVNNNTEFILDDLYLTTLKIIEQAFAKDFTSFGYPHINKNSSHKEPPFSETHPPRLEFVHIPKTGGTIIESTAALAGIRWSICHIIPPFRAREISDNNTHCPDLAPWADLYGPPIHGCPLWHLPPHYFQLPRFPHNPYNNAKLFTIVRNPFDRLVSEFFYVHHYVNSKNSSVTVDQMNHFIHYFVTRTKEATKGDIANNVTGDHKYFLNAGHFIPQYDFVFHGDQQVIHHVLKFEQLHDDFHNLMALYHLNLTLPSKQDHHVRKATKTLGVKDLTPDLILMIEEVYANDFREFGYALISSANKTQ